MGHEDVNGQSINIGDIVKLVDTSKGVIDDSRKGELCLVVGFSGSKYTTVWTGRQAREERYGGQVDWYNWRFEVVKKRDSSPIRDIEEDDYVVMHERYNDAPVGAICKIEQVDRPESVRVRNVKESGKTWINTTHCTKMELDGVKSDGDKSDESTHKTKDGKSIEIGDTLEMVDISDNPGLTEDEYVGLKCVVTNFYDEDMVTVVRKDGDGDLKVTYWYDWRFEMFEKHSIEDRKNIEEGDKVVFFEDVDGFSKGETGSVACSCKSEIKIEGHTGCYSVRNCTKVVSNKPVTEEYTNDLTSKFRVGDIIRGIEGNRYSWTDEKMTRGKVIEVYSRDKIRVEILEHETHEEQVGREWDVKPEEFELVEREFKVGDIITGNSQAHERYEYTTNRMVGKIVSFYDEDSHTEDDFRVEILEHPRYPDEVGNVYGVKERYFTLIENRGDESSMEVKPKETANGLKIGDIITGIESKTGQYRVTTEDMLGKIVEIREDGTSDDIRVKVIDHNTMEAEIGEQYNVQSKCFKKTDKDSFKKASRESTEKELTEEEKEYSGDFEVGDIVAGVPGNSYGITTEEMTRAEVIELVEDGKMRIKILEHTTYEGKAGRTYRVANSDKQFKLVEKSSSNAESTEIEGEKVAMDEIFNEVGEVSGEFEIEFNDNGFTTSVTIDDTVIEMVQEEGTQYGRDIKNAVSEAVESKIDTTKEKIAKEKQIEEMEDKLDELKEDTE